MVPTAVTLYDDNIDEVSDKGIIPADKYCIERMFGGGKLWQIAKF